MALNLDEQEKAKKDYSTFEIIIIKKINQFFQIIISQFLIFN